MHWLHSRYAKIVLVFHPEVSYSLSMMKRDEKMTDKPDLIQVKIVPPKSKAEQRRMELLLLEDFVAKGNTVTVLPASKRRSHAKTFKR